MGFSVMDMFKQSQTRTKDLDQLSTIHLASSFCHKSCNNATQPPILLFLTSMFPKLPFTSLLFCGNKLWIYLELLDDICLYPSLGVK